MNSTRGRWQEDQFTIRGRRQFPRDQKNLDENITEKVQVERTREGTQPNVLDTMETKIEPRHHDELSKENERRHQYQSIREGKVRIPGHQYRLKTEEREQNPKHQYQSTREEREQNGLDRKGRDPRFIDQREREPRLQDGYKSTRKGRDRNDQDQPRRMRRDGRVQDQFTVQEIDQVGKEHLVQKGRRDASHGDESKRETERNHRYQATREGSSQNYQVSSYQVQSTRERNDARNRHRFTIHGSDHLRKGPRCIVQRPNEGREPRHLKRERQAREGREPRDGSCRRWTRSKSRSSGKEKKRAEIEDMEKAIKDFSLRPHLKPEKNQMRSQNQENVGRNWFDLPRDVMLLILSKVGIVEILLNLPLVCSQWQDLAKDPRLFRSVVLSSDDCHLRGRTAIRARIIRKAADMSCGSLVEFWCSEASCIRVSDLLHLTPSGSSIKSLRLGTAQEADILSLLQVIKCLPSLEDIYLNDSRFPEGALDVIGNSCPNLKFASLGIFCLSGHRAFSIANTMPGLRRLCLRGFLLTKEGLQAILDGCRHLEYFHVKGLNNINKLEGSYAKRYQCKSYVKDYKHETGISELELKLNDDCRPSLIGPSNGYEYPSLPFEEYYPIPFKMISYMID